MMYQYPRRDGASSGNWTVSPTPAPASPTPTPTALPAAPSEHPGSAQTGPPYLARVAVTGGVPTLNPDVVVSAALVALFVASAAGHMAVLQSNKRKGIRFVFSGMMCVLCILRTVALSVRIAWAFYPHDANIAISAGILGQTGSVLVFVLNIILSQRIVRGYHPPFGWHWATNVFFRLLLGSIVLSLVMAITVSIQTFFTLDPTIRHIDRTAQLTGGTLLAVLAFVPIPTVTMAALVPRRYHIEKFGGGRWRTKIRLLVFTSAFATVGAVFRVSTAYYPRDASDPAWYHSRPCYYCFNFVTDLTISAVYLITRFDRRFVVPKGAKGPGDYATNLRDRPPSVNGGGGAVAAATGGDDKDNEKRDTSANHNSTGEGGKRNSAESGPPRIPSLIYERNGGKSRSTGADDADKEAHEFDNSLRRLSEELHSYPGKWDGLPWPPPVPWWASPRHSPTHPAAARTSVAPADVGDGDQGASSSFASGGVDALSDSQGSTKYGGESSASATCVQDSGHTHLAGGSGQRPFNPRPLRHVRFQSFHSRASSSSLSSAPASASDSSSVGRASYIGTLSSSSFSSGGGESAFHTTTTSATTYDTSLDNDASSNSNSDPLNRNFSIDSSNSRRGSAFGPRSGDTPWPFTTAPITTTTTTTTATTSKNQTQTYTSDHDPDALHNNHHKQRTVNWGPVTVPNTHINTNTNTPMPFNDDDDSSSSRYDDNNSLDMGEETDGGPSRVPSNASSCYNNKDGSRRPPFFRHLTPAPALASGSGSGSAMDWDLEGGNWI
ncbi:hypothetical protein F5Y17DRAFT_7367 [Xylariaceae sp. FL0594]|nr:hypothetical protein F5Y17DRAFT_7367 [Xylariaceae sp. FL0594]